jgi:hypothetical protein
MSVYGPQCGAKKDKDIVKTDVHVKAICTYQLFKDSCRRYYNAEGSVRFERGMYLICDSEYLCWSTSFCLCAQVDKSTLEGYFSMSIESVCKDVECTFGIMKKRW